MSKAKSVFIATLGSEPQVVTSALDLLIQQGENIKQVIVIHTESKQPNISASLSTLKEVLGEPVYQHAMRFSYQPVIDEEGAPLSDVKSKKGTEAAFRTIYQVVQEYKRKEYQIHLSIAGGRKSIAVFGMVSAQLLFDEYDSLWHLYSDEEYLESKRLHPGPKDKVHLIPIPIVQWSDISPILMDLKETLDPFQALEKQRKLKLVEKLEKSRNFVYDLLTPAEERVVRVLVNRGGTDQVIADTLFLSPRTVEEHLRSAYKKAQDHWMIDSVNRTSLITLLNLYYSTQDTGKPA